MFNDKIEILVYIFAFYKGINFKNIYNLFGIGEDFQNFIIELQRSVKYWDEMKVMDKKIKNIL